MRHAFTLIELVITLCVLSILSAIALPRAGRLLDSIHVHSASAEVQTMFSAARHAAIARGAQSMVEIDTVRQNVSVSIASDTILTRAFRPEHGVRLSATRLKMSYAPTGMGHGAANLSVVVRRNSIVDTVFVSRLGRVRH
jgi:prepilin-type N-terminal cleavage/methylation domain-containing protein